jgi:hypothetical protein
LAKKHDVWAEPRPLCVANPVWFGTWKPWSQLEPVLSGPVTSGGGVPAVGSGGSDELCGYGYVVVDDGYVIGVTGAAVWFDGEFSFATRPTITPTAARISAAATTTTVGISHVGEPFAGCSVETTGCGPLGGKACGSARGIGGQDACCWGGGGGGA